MHTTRSEKLDLRLTPEAKRTLNSAASAAGRSVSEFVLESALSRAEETLADRQLSWRHSKPLRAIYPRWNGSCVSRASSKTESTKCRMRSASKNSGGIMRLTSSIAAARRLIAF